MGKRNKKQKLEKDEIEEGQSEKPSGLKLVLKVGTPQTPSDVTADSQSETFDSDTAMSERKAKRPAKRQQPQQERLEHRDKKRKQDEDEESDFVDEEDGEDKDRLSEVADDDPRGRNLREKRPTVVADEDQTALQTCLEYLQKILQRKDGNGFFAFPVTESIAPGYYSIIAHPMDFSTMKSKIDNWEYHSVADYKADYQLMMNNCMQYNHPDTVYHREAKRLLSIGLKHMSRERLLQMKRNLPSMSTLTYEELGLDGEAPDGASVSSESRARPAKERSAHKRQSLSRFEAIPDKMTPDEILRQAQNAAKGAADRLALRAPDSKMGFLRRREDGSTTLNILNSDNSGIVSETERIVSLGELVGKLTAGTGSLSGLKEDRRNKINPINYLSYSAFSSHAPIYDSSSSNLSKELSDMLVSTYGDESGIQYAKSLQAFVADCGDYAVKMVDNLLDILTDCEHSKTNAAILQKEQEKLRQEEEEAKKRLEKESEAKQPSTADSCSTDEVGATESESQRCLDRVGELIVELQKLQNARLGQPLPSHLADVSGPSLGENELAQKLLTELTQIIKQLAPSDVVALSAIRNALGITCEPMTTEELADLQQLTNVDPTSGLTESDQPTSKQSEIDEDLNEFFAQGCTSGEVLVDATPVVNLVDTSAL